MALLGLLYVGAEPKWFGQQGAVETPQDVATLWEALPQPYAAPDFTGTGKWFNADPLTLASLRGKVVLLNFWAYACVNCARTIPFLKAMSEKYRDQGLVVLGIHSPEFEFERDADNLQKAIAKYGIHYPVVQDNDMDTWSAYKNRFWPSRYLIDQKGDVVYSRDGEGGEDIIEHNIRLLLGLGPEPAPKTAKPVVKPPALRGETADTFLGYDHGDLYAGREPLERDGLFSYHSVILVPEDHWSLDGTWRVAANKIVAMDPRVSVWVRFKAKKVYAVIGSTHGKTQKLDVTFNDNPIGYQGGADVHDGVVTVDTPGLYEIVNQTSFAPGLLQLTSETPNVVIYAFTFGE